MKFWKFFIFFNSPNLLLYYNFKLFCSNNTFRKINKMTILIIDLYYQNPINYSKTYI